QGVHEPSSRVKGCFVVPYFLAGPSIFSTRDEVIQPQLCRRVFCPSGTQILRSARNGIPVLPREPESSVPLSRKDRITPPGCTLGLLLTSRPPDSFGASGVPRPAAAGLGEVPVAAGRSRLPIFREPPLTTFPKRTRTHVRRVATAPRRV